MKISKETWKLAFVKSLPIMCSYFFLGAAYGIMMEETGFPWYVALLLSMTVYTGAFQFVLITFLSTGASLLTIAITALLMNSRQGKGRHDVRCCAFKPLLLDGSNGGRCGAGAVDSL